MDRQEALAKLQATELEILVAFSNYCRKHNIPWFMDSGTVLGAKRHGGFIPWDDDIDVGMLRADYNRFIRLSQSGFIEGYSVHTPDNTEGFAGTVLVPTSVLEFEGVRLPAPAQPERYLELMYGDWETLPAPEDRRTHLPVRLVFGDGTYWSNS